uniref:Dual serine/threonine and tyrosine protein kinase n=1 Tax=Strigamia maritima TaxID=126957 RepID=T1JM86_STRMM
MVDTLPFELSTFSKHSRHLKRILKQTQCSLDEMRTRSKFYAEQIAGVTFTAAELIKIKKVIEHPPCFIVLGQNTYGKTCVVNGLFSQTILPYTTDVDETANWRGICFQYGVCNQASLILPDSFELAVPLKSHIGPWITVHAEDLTLDGEAKNDPAQRYAILEIRLRQALLKDDVKVIVTPSKFSDGMQDFIVKQTEDAIPLLIYAIADDTLSSNDLEELIQLKSILPNVPVFFVRTPPMAPTELTESEQHTRTWMQPSGKTPTSPFTQPQMDSQKNWANICQNLREIGYLTTRSTSRHNTYEKDVESEFVESFENFGTIHSFVRHFLKSQVVQATTLLNDCHSRFLRMFIMSAFDMTRDMLITPKRLEYAREREVELFNTLNDIASHKQDEIRNLIADTITSMKDELVEKAAAYQFKSVEISADGDIKTASELKVCTNEIEDLILGDLNINIAQKLINSIQFLKESIVGTLERCLHSLEFSCKEEGDSPQASAALAQVLNSAYKIEITAKTSSSFMSFLWEKMKQVVQSMPWNTPPRVDSEWRRKVAIDMINRLSDWRLAKSISSQFRDKLKDSHDFFLSSLRELELRHTGRLEKTEERRLKLRKQVAPKLARYALESTSLRDNLLYGMPAMEREIGRGQYGVVYACNSWGTYSPCAIKSVVPPDEKHWNDLAMEYYYTRSVPPHSHVVTIRGSVIDYSYGGGTSPAVLLIMERFQKDLHTAIKSGLNWLNRLQVAIDVVQGIRFLHSQGLIHRDIKLKNVLLDKNNRAKITDLGFCKSEAMMSGSIVGTPIHMAPELFSGRYDSTVDVYAFGILFWYICAGHVRLPYVYEQCQNKDQLWTAVRRAVILGSRPERLPQFDDLSWELMEQCWAGDSIIRPLLGDVENKLRQIKEKYSHTPLSVNEDQQPDFNFGLMSSSPFLDYREIENSAFTTEEWTAINRLVDDKPISFFVLGQNSFSKTCVVNELFSQIIIPHIIEAGDRSCLDDICLNYEGVFIKQRTLFPYNSNFGTTTYITAGRPQISVRADDLMFGKGATRDPNQRYTRLEIQVRKSVLEDNYRIIITSDHFFNEMETFIKKHMETTTPILIYSISEETLSKTEMAELKQLIKLLPNVPIFLFGRFLYHLHSCKRIHENTTESYEWLDSKHSVNEHEVRLCAEKELELVDALNYVASHHQDEFRDLIADTISCMKEELIHKAALHQFTTIQIPDNGTVKTYQELKICNNEIEAFILGDLNARIERDLISSFHCLKEGFVGTLQRSLHILENGFKIDAEKFQTSGALALILNSIAENMPWNKLPKVDADWKQKIATNVIARINSRRLASDIGLQLCETVKESHNLFVESLEELSVQYIGRLERDFADERKIRKCVVPDLSDITLRSAALRDTLLHGLPELGKKIACGRFGVAYNCGEWNGHSQCAMKTIIPPNSLIWKTLSVELHYAMSLPTHPNIVSIWGTVIDHEHRKGSSPAVCIIMDKFKTDLHTGIDKGLSWLRRLHIAIDVVEGLCFLHSKKLIHRNIKLRNILLDETQRAKITDFGCCTEETFTSLPVPVHLAPELFRGSYNYATDVYAFGVLFWYICVGRVLIPTAYRYCYTKQFLYAVVKDGHRPERFPHFNDPCWEIMEKCWAGESNSRPFIVEVKNQLYDIRQKEFILKRRTYYQQLAADLKK